MLKVNVDTLIQVHQLMNEMHTAATESDWELLISLDSQRRKLLNTEIESRDINNSSIERAISEPRTVNQDHQQLVEKILELDSCIFQILTKAKESLVSENREFSAQKNAAAGYAKAHAFT